MSVTLSLWRVNFLINAVRNDVSQHNVRAEHLVVILYTIVETMPKCFVPTDSPYRTAIYDRSRLLPNNG